ncbi:MAG: biopolymer transporter ExbD [Thiopseudomonas sp.]|nr:biopolymer transporter ExbD [Thiopseudomonas sp.]MBP9614730.1 biopolymer transporter ExbD [Thiopseudomonas sp.]HAB91865.1 biopolymer transporter ExbD [Pseudomonas sp.]HHX06773.1 biopolymer transporter ExbD [Pseudomonas sp.]
MKFPRKPREPVDINLAPLIDVVFILLLFFVVTTTFTRETQLKVDLPEAVSGTPPEVTKTPLEILVGVDGSFALNGKSLSKNDLASLMEALRLESGGDKSLPVMLSADGKAPHQAVVTAMDAASKLGFAHLRITTVEAQAQ